MTLSDELRSIWGSIAVVNFVASSINTHYTLTQKIVLSQEVEEYEAGSLEIARLIHGMSSLRDDVTAAWLGMSIAEKDFLPSQDPRQLLDPHLFRGAVGLYEQKSIMDALDESHLRRPWPSLINSVALDFMALSMGLEARANRTLTRSYLSLCSTLSSSNIFNQSEGHPNFLIVTTLLFRVNSVVSQVAAGGARKSIGEVQDIFVDGIDDNLGEWIGDIGSNHSFQGLPEWFGEIRENLLRFAAAEAERKSSLNDAEIDIDSFEPEDDPSVSMVETEQQDSGEELATRLRRLEGLLEQDLISQGEYERQRERILGEL